MGGIMSKRSYLFFVICLILLLTACDKNDDKKEPIVLTIWHVYGGQVDSPLNKIIYRNMV